MKHVVGNYWVDADEYCITLYEKQIVPELNSLTGKKNKNAGKEAYVNPCYYPNLKVMLNRLAERGIDTAFVNGDIKKAIELSEELKQRINDIRANSKVGISIL